MNNCIKCNSTKITHTERTGRGLAPKSYKRPIIKKMSWRGIWDFHECQDCNHVEKKLRR